MSDAWPYMCQDQAACVEVRHCAHGKCLHTDSAIGPEIDAEHQRLRTACDSFNTKWERVIKSIPLRSSNPDVRVRDDGIDRLRSDLAASNARVAELENWKREAAELLMSLDRERSASNTRLTRQSAVIEAMDEALVPFAFLSKTMTVELVLEMGGLLTLSNGERMCGVQAKFFTDAVAARAARAAMEGEVGG